MPLFLIAETSTGRHDVERNPSFRDPAKTIYTCPMHPQIEQDHPGNCPICGMALEPKNAGAGSDEENAELRDMTRRFWIGAALTLAGLHARDGASVCRNAPTWVDSDPSRWMQFVLTTPVVLVGRLAILSCAAGSRS